MTQTLASPAGYTGLQKRLHWLVAVLILLQFLVFDEMGRPYNQGLRAGEMPYDAITIGHIAVGSLILLLAAWRILLRIRHGAPELPAEEPPVARIGAAVAHWGLYVLLFALPITGLIGWFGGAKTLAGLHEAGSNLLLALAGLHVLAVAAHQFWWRTGLLRRMT